MEKKITIIQLLTFGVLPLLMGIWLTFGFERMNYKSDATYKVTRSHHHVPYSTSYESGETLNEREASAGPFVKITGVVFMLFGAVFVYALTKHLIRGEN